MEERKKLNTPSGNIHDIKYLYNIIAGLKRKGGRVESNLKNIEYFKKIINDYNDAKASKYGLSSKPPEVNIKVIKHLIAELKYLKLLRKEKGYLILTNDGETVASLIEQKDSNGLKKVFIKLMLEKFNVFEYFLRRIKEVSNGSGVPIPIITSNVFDKCGGDSKKIAENYITIVNNNCSNIITEPDRLYDLLENAKVDSIEKRTYKINKLQAIIERFMVSEVFGPTIKSRRVYDFVRSRTTFLELTNYATFNFEGFSAEVTYLISDFVSSFNHGMKMIDYSNGRIYINYPAFEEIRETIKETMVKIYNAYKDEFGYMKIADMRDMVCKELKISDNLFDEYLKKLYQEESHWLTFTYAGAGDKITEKRLPIIFEKPMRGFFTLLKLNLRR
jgi:hypothetical protein